MAQPAAFRQYKFPHVGDTQFFTATDERNKLFARQDLAKSGLTLDDIGGYTHPLLQIPEGAQAGYVIPYYGLDGKPITNDRQELIMWRTRLLYPEFAKESRYIQPSGAQLSKLGLPPFMPYMTPQTFELRGNFMICAEGEKKAASVMKFLDIPAFGIGGCQMWRDPAGTGGVHPWILKLLDQQGYKSVVIIPDADVFRYDICNAYGTFAAALQDEGYEVLILNPPDKIDDLLVRWGDKAKEKFYALEQIDPNNLVQSPASLVRKYNLAFKTDSKDRIVVHQNTSNVMKLLENHNAFPKVWYNLDTGCMMVGDEPIIADATEMKMANHIQHNFGLEKVSHNVVLSCVRALAKSNQRSPMLEWIQEQIWDGKPRLESWLHRLWGVEDTEFASEVGKKWLVAACARLDRPGCKMDWMFITISTVQGVGKTSMPDVLFRGNSLTLYGEQNDKDLHMKIHSALCIGFDEMDSFGKRETSFLKAMITTCEDRFRPPYGSSVEIFKRRNVLYGCGNQHDFLRHDPSGYRRYAIVEVKQLLDFSGLQEELGQLWAEAWHEYKMGCKFWELENVSENAENFTADNAYEEAVLSALDRVTGGKVLGTHEEGYVYFQMVELLAFMGMDKHIGNPGVTKEVSALLRLHGAERVRKRFGDSPNPRKIWRVKAR